MFIGDHEQTCVASESCQILPRDQSVKGLITQQRGNTEKSGLRDVKRADFIQNWRRSGLKNPDKPRFLYFYKE